MPPSNGLLDGYEHTPFPDVSGLRSNAPGRERAIECQVTLKETLESLDETEASFRWERGTLLTAAWAVLLSHSLHQERTDVAFLVRLEDQDDLTAIRCEETTLASDVRGFCQVISGRLEQKNRVDGSCELDTLVDLGESKIVETSRSGSKTSLSIRRCRPEVLELKSSPAIHSQQSAILLLDQLIQLLQSFQSHITSSNPLAASDPQHLPLSLRASNNTDPQKITLDDDGSLDQELFHHQFERMTKLRPDAIALDFRYDIQDSSSHCNTRWTYRELNDLADRFADHLLLPCLDEASTNDQRIVALCLEKSPEMYLAILATLKAGAIWCPIDPDWPQERKKALLKKSEAPIVLTLRDESIASACPEGLKVIQLQSLDQLPPATQRLKTSSPSSSGLAYKIWTSGTTGLPKAVGIEHRAAVQALRSLQQAIPHDGGESIRYLQFSAYVFDLSILDCFYTWGLGGTLCSCPRELLLGDLVGVANSFQATHSLLTPAVLAMTPREAIPTLKVVINGGEKLTQVVADIWSVDCCLLNLYGPAEATLIAMQRRVPEKDIFKAPNIGIALPTVSCHALDKRGRVVLKGAIGELALGGYQCARGYLGDEAKTQQVFKDHAQLGRIYMTGDFVRQLPDESFEYLGRGDDQIKINGIRIETLEISAIVKSSHQDVKDSETLSMSLGAEDQMRIVSFSVLPSQAESGSSPLRLDAEAARVARALRESAQAKLPSYMVPSLFLIVSSFPRTPSAKIDRVALKRAIESLDIAKWEAAIAGNDEEDQETSKTEQTLLSLVAELCCIDSSNIGRRTPFPSIGLDSIKAMVLARRLTEQDLPTSVIDIVQYPNVQTLAQKLDSMGRSSNNGTNAGEAFLSSFDKRYRAAVANLYSIDASQIQAVLPTTPLQQGMLAETMRSKTQTEYWLNRLYTLDSTVDPAKLKRAIHIALEKIAGCRTCFCEGANLSADDSSSTEPSIEPFLQVIRKDVVPQVEQVICESNVKFEQQLQQAAISMTETSPVGDRPPLAVVIGQRDGTVLLLLRAHHALYDAQSLELLQSSIVSIVTNESPPALGSMASALGHLLPHNEEEEAARRHCWEEALKPVPRQQVVTFPNLTSRVAKPSASPIYRRSDMKATVNWSALSDMAQKLNTSARPIAQSAWASVLAAYLETDWIILGDSISTRTAAPGLENVFGPLHATIPVPICISGDSDTELTRRQVIDDCDNFHKATLQHQHVSLAYVRQLLQISTDQPLFQSVFVFEVSRASENSLFLSYEDLDLSVEHPLAIEVTVQPNEDVQIALVYRDDVLPKDHADLLLRQFDASLSTFCSSEHLDASPQHWTGQSFDDDALLSISRPRKSFEVERARSISAESWLSHYAKERPDDAALELWTSFDQDSKPEVISYKSLHDRSQRLANYLRYSLPAKSVVAVCLQRCVDTYVALLATQLSGMVYLPLDEHLPTERQQLLVMDSEAACVLTHGPFADRFDKGLAVNLDEQEVPSRIASAPPASTQYARLEDLSYILYTSGSTGTPKGCLLTRSNLSTTIEAFLSTFEAEAPGSFQSNARFLARSAEAFDVALLETFLPLRTGSTIVTGPRQLILQDLRVAMRMTKVTHAAVVPSLSFSQGQRIQPSDLPDLRALIVGGEKIAQDIIDIWAPSKVPVLNAFGPSETTIGNSMARVRADSSTSDVGRCFPGSRYIIVDAERKQGEELRPTLRGQAGELCIVGPQVGQGYLGQTNPPAFGQWRGQPMYRTGDLARLTMDDEAQYLGRIDGSQVKIRGARLELGEIDHVLKTACQSSKLQVATIYVAPSTLGTSGSGRIISFIAFRTTSGQSVELQVDQALAAQATELYAKASTALPPHMRPSAIVAVNALPLAAISGKIDVQRLKTFYLAHQEDFSLAQLAQKEERPLTEREQLIADEMRAVVPTSLRQDLKSSSNLFASGLDSLTAITLVSRLRRRGVKMSVMALLSSASLEEAARSSEQQGSTDKQQVDRGDSDLVEKLSSRARELKIPHAEESNVYPCTPLQESLIAETLSSTRHLYISKITVDLPHGVDMARLKESVDAIIEANEIWRTAFVDIDGSLRQIVMPPGSTIPWTNSKADLQPADMMANLASRPPLKIHIEAASGACRMVLLAHHAIYDGVSLDLFLADIKSHYQKGKTTPGPPFHQAALAIATADQAAAENYWASRLQDCTLTPFPSLHPLNLPLSTNRRETTLKSRHSASSIASIASKHNVTSQALLITAWSILLSHLTGESDTLFGLVLSGRTFDLPGAETIQGPLVTTVPFRSTRKREDSITDCLQHTHQDLLQTIQHQHTSLRAIPRWTNIDQPLFNTLFSYLPTSSQHDGVFYKNVTTDMQTEYPLAIEIESSQKDDGLLLRIVHDPDSIMSAQADLLLRQLDTEIARLVGPHVAIEKDLLSVSNPDPKMPSSEDSSLSRFRVQVTRRPDATAVEFAENGLDRPFKSLTYAQLDAWSEQIRQQIESKSSNGIAAVHMQRSLLFYATLVAVWKAGKTYMPLDPSLPADRLEQMIRTVGQALVITDEDCKAMAHRLSSDVLALDTKRSTAVPQRSTSLAKTDLGQTAYILFTSGSTGKPKAVPISHRALAAALLSWQTILPHNDDSRMLQLASSSFDVSLIEICMPLSFGFTVVSAPKDIVLNDLEESFRKLRLTMADLPASLATMVHPQNVPRLQWLMSGGDMIDERVLKEWGPKGLINAHGPTETTIGNTLGFVNEKSKRFIVGKAYPTSSIYILEKDSKNLTYLGGVGEIAIGGPQLAEGYVGREDLTQGAFIKLRDGTSVYRTGDRGRLLPTGELEVLGRISRGQVKLRGQRLELEEVSHAFRRQEHVRDADTLFVRHPELPAKQLVTWISLNSGHRKQGIPIAVRSDEIATNVARTCLREVTRALAAYMIPSHLLAIEGPLPMTPNNKIDHTALEIAFKQLDLKMLQTATEEGQEAEEWSEAEQRLRTVIAAFCDLDSKDLSRTTSFYRLGVDSLSAIRLARQMKTELSLEVTAKDVLRWSNIAQLAANASAAANGDCHHNDVAKKQLEAARGQIDMGSLLISPSDDILSLLPCTPLQEGMIDQTLASHGRLYYHHHPLRLSGATEEAIRSAWRIVVEQRDILRTTFHRSQEEKSWVQAVHKESFEQLRCLKASSFAEIWEQLIAKSPLTKAEDFAKPSTVLTLCDTGDELFVILSLHHALYDGNALPMLFDDLDQALASREPPHRKFFSTLAPYLLPEKTATEHWVKRINGYETRRLLPEQDDDYCTHEVTLSMSLSLAEAQAQARNLEVSLRTIAALAFGQTLARRLASRDIVFGQILALRDALDGAEAIIGPAFNTVPTRVQFHQGKTIKEILQDLQSASDEDRPHRNASLRSIQKQLGLLRAPFDALMDYQVVGDTTEWKYLRSVEMRAAPVIQFPLNVEFHQESTGLSISATATEALMNSEELHEFVGQIEKAMKVALFQSHRSADESLPAPSPTANGINGKHNGSNCHPSWTDLELQLRTHLAAILQCKEERIKPESSLASLGLDSISALQFASRARQAGIAMTIGDVVAGSTLRGVARRTEAKQNKRVHEQNGHSHVLVDHKTTEAVAKKLNIDAQHLEAVLPALPGQTFQLASWLHSGQRFGIYSWVWRLEAAVDIRHLHSAWIELRRRHSILRTGFAVLEDQVYQAVWKAGEDVTGDEVIHEQSSKSSNEDSVKAKLKELASATHTFQRPPVRLLVQTSRKQSMITLNLSHALYDAWSIGILAKDLESLYRASKTLPPTVDYARFVQRHADLRLQNVHKERHFWQQELQGVRATTLSPCCTKSSNEEGFFLFEEREMSLACRQCRGSNLPPLQYICMAAWTLELARLTRSRRPVFGLYQSNRAVNFEGIEAMTGPTLNALPVCPSFELDGSDDAGDNCSLLLKLAKDLQAGSTQRSSSLQRQQASLADIHEWLDLPVNRPLFDTYLNLLWQEQGPASQQHEATFKPVKLGNPQDFAPTEPLQGAATLQPFPARWSGAVQPMLEIDIVLPREDDRASVKNGDTEKKTVGTGMRCNDSRVLNEKACRAILRNLVRRVEEAIGSSKE